jgi:hypothetical protein
MPSDDFLAEARALIAEWEQRRWWWLYPERFGEAMWRLKQYVNTVEPPITTP